MPRVCWEEVDRMLKLVHRLRRWPNINSILNERLVFAGNSSSYSARLKITDRCGFYVILAPIDQTWHSIRQICAVHLYHIVSYVPVSFHSLPRQAVLYHAVTTGWNDLRKQEIFRIRLQTGNQRETRLIFEKKSIWLVNISHCFIPIKHENYQDIFQLLIFSSEI